MLEIILLLIVGLALLAKKTPKRRRFNLRKVKASPSVGITTLASVTAFTGVFFGNADGAYRPVSMESTWSMEDHVPGEGPILVGYAHGDYTVAEIKEFILSGSSINIGNMVERERAERRIRHVGTFSGENASETLNDGRPIKTRLNWRIPIGTNLNVWFFNDSINALSGSTVMKVNGHSWVRDL